MPSTPFQTVLDQDLLERARAKAATSGTTLDKVVSDLIIQWTGDWKPPAPASGPPPGSTPPSTPPSTDPSTDSKPEQRIHIVKNGDSLWKLAAKYYGDGNKYMLIARENDIHAENPLAAGMQLAIPPDPTAAGIGIIPEANVAPKPGYPIVPDGLANVKQVFGGFTYGEIRGKPLGRIQINAQWLANNIIRAQVPALGTIQCHKLLAPVFVALFRELEAQKLTAGLKYDGCFVSRHKMWNPRRGLSVHSWGIAIDLNAGTNAVGTAGTMDVRLIKIFADHGFYWGGNFGDPMHFQYCLNY